MITHFNIHVISFLLILLVTAPKFATLATANDGTNSLQILEWIPENNTLLQGKQAIEIIFNQPIIALGADFNDSSISQPVTFHCNSDTQPSLLLHWISTSIFRIDPSSGEWPTNLQCSLSVRYNLTTFDGDLLTPRQRFMTYRYHTPTLQIQSIQVYSKRATEISNGQWNSFHPKRSANSTAFYEIPPTDSMVIICFSSTWEFSFVKKFISFTEMSCGVHNLSQCSMLPYVLNSLKDQEKHADRCLNISFPEALKSNRFYAMYIPKGAQYNKDAGPLEIELTTTSQPFTGLLPFQFEFLPRNSEIVFNRWRLWLLHGIQGKTKTLKMQLLPRPDNLMTRISRNYIELQAGFTPNRTYTLTIDGSSKIFDDYYQSLITSGPFVLRTAAIPPIQFLLPSAKHIQFASNDMPNSYSIFYANLPTATSLKVASMTKADIVDYLMKSQRIGSLSSSSYQIKQPLLSLNSQGLIDGGEKVQKLDLPVDWLLGGDKVFLLQIQEPYYPGSKETFNQLHFVSQIAYSAQSISIADGKLLLLWISSVTQKGSKSSRNSQNFPPIENVKVTIFRNGKEIATNHTDYQGFVMFDLFRTITRQQEEFVVYSCIIQSSTVLQFIESLDVLQIIEGQKPIPHPAVEYSTLLFTDRKFYNLGDTVHFMGFIRKFLFKELTFDIFNIHHHNFTIQLTPEGLPAVDLLKTLQVKHGSIEGSFRIPMNFTYETHTLSIDFEYPKQLRMAVSFNILNPRIPTEFLELSSTTQMIHTPISSVSTIKDLSEVQYEVQLRSYTGMPVGNANISIHWTLKHPSMFCWGGGFLMRIPLEGNPCMREEVYGMGTEWIITKSDGKAQGTIVIPQELLNKMHNYGDVFTIFASHFSVTLEYINQITRNSNCGRKILNRVEAELNI